MNLRQIEVFRAVMATGSISDAARALHVSQPGISRLVRHLELRLRVALFERRRGKLVATPEALALHAEIEKVYRGIATVQDFAAGLASGAHARIAIGATQSVGLEAVPRAVARFAAQHPTARLSLEVLTLAQMTELLLAEHLDVGVSALPLDHPGLELAAIGRWRMVVVAPPGHPLAARPRVRVRDALVHPLVSFSPETAQGRIIDGWYARERLPRRVSIEVRSAQTACALAACGAGAAVVDDLTAQASASPSLVVLPLVAAPEFPIYAVRNAHRPPSLPVQRFLALLGPALASPPPTVPERSRGRAVRPTATSRRIV